MDKSKEKSSIEKINILSDGYGLIPQIVTRDTWLSPGAKALYAYLSSFAGAGGTCFPSRDIMVHELNINKDTFTKYLNELKTCGYIRVHKKTDKGKKVNNIYEIVFDRDYIDKCILKRPDIKDKNKPRPKKQDMEPHPNFSDMVQSDMVFSDMENSDSISNSINNNSININSSNSSCSCIGELDKVLEFYITNISKESITLFEKEEIEKLHKQLGHELLLEAMIIAVKNNKRTLGYIHGITKKWLDAKVTTLEELKIYEVKYSKKNASNSINKDKNFIPNYNFEIKEKKTRFHNFNERGINYTPEELEKILKENQKGKFN